MKSVNFNAGYTEYAVNGDETNPIRINIRDVNIIKRIEKAQEKLTALQARYEGVEELAAQDLIAIDEEIRSLLNATFATDISTAAFGETNCMTDVGNGEPLFKVFLEAFLPVVTEDIKAAAPQPKVNPNVQKYVAPIVTRKQPIAGLANPMGAIDIGTLSKEEKTALLAQLIS